MAVLSLSCKNNYEFDTIASTCPTTLEVNMSLNELAEQYDGEVFQIQEDWIVEGYVISSDKAGNFFNVLHIQDHPSEPTMGAVLEIDQRESHLFYQVGSRVGIKLKGLYVNQNDGLLELGGAFTSFGSISVGRIPSAAVPLHVYTLCTEPTNLLPTPVDLQTLVQQPSGTLIQLQEIEMADAEIGNTFAVETEDTQRILQDCEETQTILLNSGYSDFQSEILPEGKGTLTGVLLKDGDDFQIVIRDLDDIQFTDERCPEIITEFTSENIFISELADPDNNAKARFVELYNSADEPLDLNLWKLRRYTNDNIEISSEIDLSGYIMEGKSTLVISPNAEEFELAYGFAPDLGVSTNSPADSNGDDNLELVDPFGKVIDVFGIVGEDGSGTNHEFEDGRALRKSEVIKGNPVYTFEEWIVCNDTGES
ncbi:MAG: DUF5689 domain-containing protein, partial [Bacteroidota bacterium]